ncbi:MAG: tetratricopeptide repeat protein [Polyangiaceae bacterium]|nr:tetratricopeptide repeat protein [Polyangiaceae bacterium]
MGFLSYYVAILVASYLLRFPLLIPLVLVFWALRHRIPDPYVWARTAGHIHRLRQQVEANPANAVARRDLARLHLERFRPRAALGLLDEALARHPDDAEMLYLKGIAHLRAGEAGAALDPVVRAIELDGRIGFGDPYRVAGDALVALGRLEEAEDAYERFTEMNSSSLEGLYKLTLVRSRRGDRQGAQLALDELFRTHRQLPAFSRRRQVGWWLRAQLARFFMI